MYSSATKPIENQDETNRDTQDEVNDSETNEENGEKEKNSGNPENVGDVETGEGTRKQPLTNSFLFACIFGRCGDGSASVRAQALKTLGDITTDQSDEVKEVITKIFSPGKADRGQVVITDIIEDDDADPNSLDLLPSGSELIQFLRQ